MSSTRDERDLAGRIQRIRDEIGAACARAGRDPASVTLVGVAKGHPPEAVRAAVELGVVDIGESYVQEWQDKAAALRELTALRWHFVGHLQRNKARFVAEGAVHRLHSLDSVRLAETLARRVERTARRPLEILIEVNLADEADKAGTDPAGGLAAVLDAADQLEALRPVGLMCIPPAVDEPEQARPYFARLRELRERLNAARSPGQKLTELSMGMSHDFAVAIEEGATHVRVGTALFGPRPGQSA